MAVSCRISRLSFGIGSYALVAGGAQEGATRAAAPWGRPREWYLGEGTVPPPRRCSLLRRQRALCAAARRRIAAAAVLLSCRLLVGVG